MSRIPIPKFQRSVRCSSWAPGPRRRSRLPISPESYVEERALSDFDRNRHHPALTHHEPFMIHCLAASICPAGKCLISADTKCDVKCCSHIPEVGVRDDADSLDALVMTRTKRNWLTIAPKLFQPGNERGFDDRGQKPDCRLPRCAGRPPSRVSRSRPARSPTLVVRAGWNARCRGCIRSRIAPFPIVAVQRRTHRPC